MDQQQTNPADVSQSNHLVKIPAAIDASLWDTPGLYVRNDTGLDAKMAYLYEIFFRNTGEGHFYPELYLFLPT